jgi:hypothetical protein
MSRPLGQLGGLGCGKFEGYREKVLVGLLHLLPTVCLFRVDLFASQFYQVAIE